METIVVSLTEFQPEELQLLYQLFNYNRDNLVEDKAEIGMVSNWLPGFHLRDNRYASSKGLRSLLRHTWFVFFIVQQLEAALSQQVPLDRAIDLSPLPDPQAFLRYLQSELHRNELGAQYTQRVYRNSQTGQRLLDAFSLEYRFLNLLCRSLE